MKILNLYAGIGCNRALWKGHEVTAVEIDVGIAEIYQARFPDDFVVMGDAHRFLEENHEEYDVVWSSPPCPTHSTIQHSRKTRFEMVYPDMSLYEEIIFLRHWFQGKWVVENVIPYYTPLIKSTVEIDRHLFWGNTRFRHKKHRRSVKIRSSTKEEFARYHNISGDIYEMLLENGNARKILRNGVHERIGKFILDEMINRKNIRKKF